MLTKTQSEAARTLCQIGFAHSDMIDRHEIGLATAEEYSAYCRGITETVIDAESAYYRLTDDRLPDGPLGLVIAEVAWEIASRLGASDANRGRGGPLVFQAAHTLCIACGISVESTEA